MAKIKRIAYLTLDDPMDKRSWSGIYFQMLRALKCEFEEVIPLGPIKAPTVEFLVKIFQFLTLLIFQRRYDRSHSLVLSKTYSYIIKRKIRNKKIDAIFAPSASSLIAFLKTDIPIYYYSDATGNLLIDYYFFNLSKLSKKEVNLLETKTLNKSKVSIFSSGWCAADAIKTYHIDPNKVKVVKMGANIQYPPTELNIKKKLENKTCNLLFVGVDWKRKGGDIVLKAFDLLTDKGFNTHLTICGCVPPETRKNMTIYPFLNKNKEDDYKIFNQLFDNAHIFFLPTRAECSAIVFCEAAAFGIPTISTDTGGVSSYIRNSKTGFILPLNAQPKEYAEAIENTFENKELYKKLAQESRREYLKELNWKVWGTNIFNLIQNNNC